jgi:glucosylglycerate synthase
LPETGVVVQNGGGSIQEVGAADILVGIPTYNNADTIRPLMKAAQNGVQQFSSYKAVIMQADGGSDDSTVQTARDALSNWPNLIQVSYPLYPVHRLAVPFEAVPGRDSAFQTIFSTAERLGVRACCIIEPGIQTVTTDWIGSLVQPVLESGFDFVAPQYLRHKYEGMLTNGILYPMVRALFGKQIRQPIGRDFGFSGAFIRHCLSDKNWNREIGRHAVDLCTTLEAILGGFKLCQALLGPRPVKRDQLPDLSTILTEAVGSLFGQVELTAEHWHRVHGSETVPAFGLRFDSEPGDPSIDVRPMIEKFRLGFVNLQEIWGLILPPATLLEVKKMSRQTDETFRFPDELWVRAIYDFAVAYRLRTIGRDHLMGAFTPLYLAWTASFIQSVRGVRPREVASRIEHLCKIYETEKPYLISRWRWPDRFMP